MLEKLTFYIKHSFNDLRINGRRTLFALMCIAAGVAAIVSLQTLGVMIKDSLTGSLRESNRGDIRIFSDSFFGDETDDDFNDARRERDGLLTQIDGSEAYYFSAEGLDLLRQWFADNYEGAVQFTYRAAVEESTAGFSLSIPEKDTNKTFVDRFFIEGQQYPLFGNIQSDDDQALSELLQNPTDIVLSRNLADDLGAEVGDTIRLSQATEDFTVTGIVPTDSEGGFENILGGILGYYYVDVSAESVFEDFTLGTASTVFIGLDDPTAVDDINRRLEARYPYLETRTTTQLEEDNSQISDVVNDLVTIMGLISMLIGGIGIVNTMLVIVSRRTTEIAVLKTIGLEPGEITTLFLVEALLMGLIGGLVGILWGWGLAVILQGVAGRFVAQSLSFRITFAPAFNGLVVGMLVTTIFGFLPTLAAGQVRPAHVLRPSETVIPTNGRLRSFAALMVVVIAISLVAQGLIGGLLDFESTIGSSLDDAAESQLDDDPSTEVTTSEDLPGFVADLKIFNLISGANGAIIGLLMAIPIILGGFLSMRAGRRGRSWLLRLLLLWPALLFGLPMVGFVFGYTVPTVLITSITFLLVGSLYLLLMLLIWAVGGGRISEFPVLGNLPGILRVLSFIFFPLWTGLIVLVVLVSPGNLIMGLFFGLLFWIHIPAIIVTLTLPGWVLGWLLQRFAFLDLKIALRAMVSTKGRGASTLLALVIGIFTLSLITMMVDTIISQFNELLEEQTGGNVIIFPAGGDETIGQVENVLAAHQGVSSYAVVRGFDAEFVKLQDVSAEDSLTMEELQARVLAKPQEGLAEPEVLADTLPFTLQSLDARDLNSNLPDVAFYDGRQLDPATDGEIPDDDYWPIVIPATEATLAADIEVGDLITFAVGNDASDNVTFRIVGMTDRTGGSISGFGADNYTPLQALGEREPSQIVAIAEVDEEQIGSLRRQLAEIPAVFVLETRFINELITAIIRQFTSFPILVAALALFTGGIVIANSVALSTLERRREIGIMKAVGLQRERVLGMLLLENGLMGFIGGLIGVGISVLLLIFALTAVFEGELGDAIPYGPAFILMGLCILIALVAALMSVWGASGEKPLNVLRYE